MKVRHPTKAGSWYPADPDSLACEIDQMLAEAADRDPGRPLALICPHAGYAYSGPAAAQAYKLAGRYAYERVVLLAPNHYVFGLRGLSLVDVDVLRTPLGDLPVDRDAYSALLRHHVVTANHGAHEEEHSLELQLPFLQRVFPDGIRVVPLVVGDLAEPDFPAAARALGDIVDDTTLVVASSDFTHYGAQFGYTPFQIPRDLRGAERDRYIEDQIRALDFGAIGPICQRDHAGFAEHLERTRDTICGFNPIGLTLDLLPGNTEGLLLDYYTSAHVTKQRLFGGRPFGSSAWEHSVSYAPIVFIRNPDYLDDTEQQQLLAIARHSIEGRLKNEPETDPPLEKLTPRLQRYGGAFVTLHRCGELRGCVGYIEDREPLYRTVQINAVNAAFHDARFRPLQPSEFGDLEIEISVLSPMTAIDSWEDIELGRHGILLTKGARRALFLPHVATEQGWDLETMLDHLGHKAGLADGEWRHGCEYEVFTAQVFHE